MRRFNRAGGELLLHQRIAHRRRRGQLLQLLRPKPRQARAADGDEEGRVVGPLQPLQDADLRLRGAPRPALRHLQDVGHRLGRYLRLLGIGRDRRRLEAVVERPDDAAQLVPVLLRRLLGRNPNQDEEAVGAGDEVGQRFHRLTVLPAGIDRSDAGSTAELAALLGDLLLHRRVILGHGGGHLGQLRGAELAGRHIEHLDLHCGRVVLEQPLQTVAA